MIHILYGDDSFSQNEALLALKETMGPPSERQSNIVEMDASGFDIAQFAAAAQTMPFLSPRRMVIVRGLLATADEQPVARRGRRASAKAGAEGGLAASLKGVLQNLPPTNDVIFLDGTLKRENPLLAELKPLAQAREFPHMNDEQLSRWVNARVRQKGGAAAPDAVALLVELVGHNLWTMDGELEKLVTYCQGRPIESADIRELVSLARETSIFDLVDAIIERRADRAMELVTRQFKGGASGPELMAMISRQARLVALAQDLLRQRVPQEQWGEPFIRLRGYPLTKTVNQARRYSAEQVRQLYRLLVETDVAMKTGDLTDELAMTELVARSSVLGAGR